MNDEIGAKGSDLSSFDFGFEENPEKNVLDSLGLKSLSDLSLGFEDEGDDSLIGMELGFDDGDSSEQQLSEATLLRSGEDMTATLVPYRDMVSEVIFVNAPKKTEKGMDDLFIVSHSEFPYMPNTHDDNVFSVFHSILIDVSTDVEKKDWSLTQRYNYTLEQLQAATGWTPRLYADQFESTFKSWCKKFRKVSGATTTSTEKNVMSLLSIDKLREAREIYTINTVPFTEVTNLLADGSIFESRMKINPNELGIFFQYLTGDSSNQTVGGTYRSLREYFNSEELATILKISVEELQMQYSVGERLRRLMLAELRTRRLDPRGLEDLNVFTFTDIYNFLCGEMEKDDASTSAEICLIIAKLIQFADRDENTRLFRFMQNIQNYLVTAARCVAKVNPVFYESVTKVSDGYELTFAVDDRAQETHSDNLLCQVVGDKVRVSCIPTVIVDTDHGCTVCPPPQLVTPLRSLQSNARLKVSGQVLYTYTPTVKWLEANHVPIQDETADVGVHDDAGLSINGKASILSTLLSYNNKFVDNMREVKPLLIDNGEATFYSVNDGSTKESMPVFLVRRNDGSTLGTRGVLVSDQTTGNVIVSFVDINNNPHDLILESGMFSEKFLGTTQDEESATLTISDFVKFGAGSKEPVEYLGLRSAVKHLCDLAAFDYYGELQDVQEIISRDLRYILRTSTIDELLASNLVDVYAAQLNNGETQTLDKSNLDSLSELLDIVVGEGNQLRRTTQWDAEAAKKFEEMRRLAERTVDQVCETLDTINMPVLALQALSRAELTREPGLDLYLSLHHIPAIGSRLALLEDQMVILRVMNQLGSGVLQVFNRRGVLSKVYREQITTSSLEWINNLVTTKMRVKSNDPTQAERVRDINIRLKTLNVFEVTGQVLSRSEDATMALLKYFILERNVYAIIDTMQLEPERFGNLTIRFLRALGLPEDYKASQAGQQDFNSRVKQLQVARLYEVEQAELCRIVSEGLMSEVITNDLFPTVKAYDMFRTLYNFIVGDEVDEELPTCDAYADDFYRHAGSFVISYCPITGQILSEVDGGMSRDVAFSKEPKDFVFSVPLSTLQGTELQDLRLLTPGAE